MIGRIDLEYYFWLVIWDESLEFLEYFIKICFYFFGIYQDVMIDWDYLLFYFKLFFVMNVKLFLFLEVVEVCVDYWEGYQE